MITFDPGLIIWTTIIFTLLLIVLRKFAWNPILTAVDDRNDSIERALKAADKAKEEMATLNADNERIINEARRDRDLLLKEARDMKNSIINEAKKEAFFQSEQIINTAKEQISNEKLKAITELKNTVAQLSIDIAEKILKSELVDKAKQEELIDNAIKASELN
jgi:F-type H+-transporting ATPase subunit b